jgi:hypothetical protein
LLSTYVRSSSVSGFLNSTFLWRSYKFNPVVSSAIWQ